ncbi:hypothetical protein FEM48_ZijujUnG0109600 [Ziziphus jujuba var. spinosa]|uniref:S-locus glycoprotein domain-containing protein n=1 Tax=Ziziphus jujuba var. spinosa TaxID=714518 RepID=A0A978U824_ZIZJJ|nr:hypothetical protein FEM48_ZijujUnG0109600 [Ziziphus jujuba var. spinosa]
MRTGLKRGLSAWRNPEDPCPGNFTYGLELGPRRYPEEYIWNGTTKYYRTGPWNGLRFSGLPELKANDVYGFKFVYSDDEVYYTYTLKVTKVISRVVLNQTTGKRERSTWIMPNDPWTVRSSLPKDKCDDYGLCGANAKCSIIGQNPISYIRKDNAKYYRTGPWNGLRYSGSPELKPNPLYGFHFVYNDDEVYYMYNLVNKSVITRIVLNQTSSFRERSTWIEAERNWKHILQYLETTVIIMAFVEPMEMHHWPESGLRMSTRVQAYISGKLEYYGLVSRM